MEPTRPEPTMARCRARLPDAGSTRSADGKTEPGDKAAAQATGAVTQAAHAGAEGGGQRARRA